MRRFAIADIHGCSKTFQKLVEQQLHLSKTDKLYLLGDYINKGPDSKGVLDYIMQLKEAGYQIELIRGNHDQMLIEMDKPEYRERWETDEDLLACLQSFQVSKPDDVPQVYLQFLTELPYYLYTDDYLLVHAGINFAAKDPFQDLEAMLNIREFDIDLNVTGGRKIIHGHTPTPLTEIMQAVAQAKDVIDIDAGCSKHDEPQFGYLAALDLDTLTLVYERYAE